MRKVVCILLATLFFIFTSCVNPVNPEAQGEDPDIGYIPLNPGGTRELTFSHNSGFYNREFGLELSGPAGSTIYYSIDGSIPSKAKAEESGNRYVFKYTSPITIKNRNGEANILSAEKNTEQMYVTKEDEAKWFWSGFSTGYIPTAAQVPKATVIRAVAVDSGNKPGSVITKTYFIGNLSNYTNHPILSLVTEPENLVSQEYGIFVRGTGIDWKDATNPYNFRRNGAEWERQANLEIFEGDASRRTVALSTGVGIRVRGGYSRAMAQKSLNVYFREEYGIKTLQNYNLITGAVKADGKTPITTYKNFVLRNGGNDTEYSKTFDRFVQYCLRDRNFSTQAQRPCIVYINGEYWGPYNLTEKYGDNHTEYKYGVTKENVISFDNDALDDGAPDEAVLYEDMIKAGTKDMSIQKNYDDFCAIVDIDNLIDYLAAQIYVFNQDWPHSNYRAWRTRYPEPGNPYGDTKWRWQMFDADASLGVIDNGGLNGLWGVDAFDQILNGDEKNSKNNRLIKALFANKDFCRKFVNNMMDLYNVNFAYANYYPILTDFMITYRLLMGNSSSGYFARWGYPYAYQGGIDDLGWEDAFVTYIGYIRNFLSNISSKMAENYLPKYFGGYTGIYPILNGKNLCDITLSTQGAPIKINTVTPNPGSTLKYYTGVPIPIEAGIPAEKFGGWTVTPGDAAIFMDETNPATDVTIIKNATITARLK